MSGFNCYFLTCTHVSQEERKVVWYSHLFKNFPQLVVIHTVKGFTVVNEAEVDVFLELACFLCDWTGVDNLMSYFSAYSKSSLYIWKLLVHVLLKPHLKDFEHYLASMWNECNCVAVWAFFVLVLLWDWNENWHFPVVWSLLSFPQLLAYWVQHLLYKFNNYLCKIRHIRLGQVSPNLRWRSHKYNVEMGKVCGVLYNPLSYDLAVFEKFLRPC